MAAPVEFEPKSVDPKLELQRRLAAAPEEHAEALLVAYDLLEQAHREGVLDALHGMMGARSTILGLAARYAAEPESTNAVRNLLSIAKIMGTLDPEPMSQLSKDMVDAKQNNHRGDRPAPSLWHTIRRMWEPDTRRGLALFTSVLAALGRGSK